MKNQELAKIFYEIANCFEMEGVDFKPLAYQKAALFLEGIEDVEKIYKKGGLKALEDLPAIGKSIALKIEEYLKNGKIKYYEQIKKQFPIDFSGITAVEGLGPKKIKILYQKLDIKNLNDLEKAAKLHKIAPLFGFGEKTEKNILEGIAFLKRSKGRFLLGKIIPVVQEILDELRSLKEVQEINVAGSVRRMKETIGDVDILVSVGSVFAKVSADAVADFFVSLPGVVKVWSKGPTKSSVRMKDGFDIDLRIVPAKSYGSGLQYFTGSKEHNIITRKIAIEKGLKLNEYGVFRGSRMLAGRTEEDVYKAIGLPWIPPEIRENEGEIEAALKGKLPKFIDYNSIRGDLHCHSDWDGGENSIEEMTEAAQKMGYEYIGISDHTKFLRIEHGLDEKKLLLQRKEIDKLNSRLRQGFGRRLDEVGLWPDEVGGQVKLKILHGCEANILNDGSVDIKDEVLAQLDYVIAGIHSNMKMERDRMTERIIKAMKNPNIDIIAHPTGRLIKKRDEYLIDFEKILRAAKETGTILEINSSPIRLDLKDSYIRRAKEMGVKMVINTDSHHKDQLRFIEFGIAQARRGWAEKEDIINTQSIEKLLEFFE